MNFSGNFERTFLTSLLQLLCEEQKSGVLTVCCGDGDKKSKVYFKNGAIVYAITTEKYMRLGQLLRTNGVITEEQLVTGLEIARRKKESIGKVLVDKGYVSASALSRFNSKHVEDILYSILLWENGRFEYKDCSLNLSGLLITELNSMRLIMEATRRIDEMSIFNKHITDENQVYKISAKAKSKHEITLNPDEWHFLSLIDGQKSVQQIINEVGYDKFTVYKMLYTLLSYGLIGKRGTVDADEQSVAKDYLAIISVYDDIFKVIHKNIIKELGQQASVIFDESKLLLSGDAATILSNFFFYLTVKENTKALKTVLDEYEDHEERCNLLITSFNQYSRIIFDKVAIVLGEEPTRDLIDETEQVLDYVNKYQLETKYKISIINEIKSFLAKIKEKLDSRHRK